MARQERHSITARKLTALNDSTKYNSMKITTPNNGTQIMERTITERK